MSKSYAPQSNTFNKPNFSPVFPYRYLYFDNYFEKLFSSKKPFSITISLFDGRVNVIVSTEDKRIKIKGDKILSNEVLRHILRFNIVKDYTVEVI